MREKHQMPNTKHQTNTKLQASNHQRRAQGRIRWLEVWSFSRVWSFVFGVSNLM
jgi:hypothetical protein